MSKRDVHTAVRSLHDSPPSVGAWGAGERRDSAEKSSWESKDIVKVLDQEQEARQGNRATEEDLKRIRRAQEDLEQRDRMRQGMENEFTAMFVDKPNLPIRRKGKISRSNEAAEEEER
jgi:hypothetical protein